MTLCTSQSELLPVKKHNYWNVVSHRLFFIFVSFTLFTVICLTASAEFAKPPFPTISLPEKSQGNRAIRALASKFPEVAAWYGSTPLQFATMMIQDNTAQLDTEGRLFFVENFPEPVFVFNTSEVGVVEDVPHERLIQSKPSNDSKIFKLPRVGGLHNRYQWKRSSLNKPY